MKSRLCRCFSVVCLACTLSPSPAVAQEPAQPAMVAVTLFELVLDDGSRMFGSVERESETEIVFRTHVGASLTVRRADVQSLRRLSGTLRGGEFMPPDPNRTRLFFAPTGRSLRRGQVSLGVYQFVAPFVQVGVTDRFSIGGGTPLLFGVEDWDRPFWVTPKLQVLDRGDTQAAVGLLHAFDSDGDGGGIAYAVVSRGTDVRSFTAGAGLAYAVGGGRAGVFMIGGDARVASRVKFVTENYLWEGGDGLATAGCRFFGERLSADLAMAFPIGADGLYAFPFINFVYVF